VEEIDALAPKLWALFSMRTGQFKMKVQSSKFRGLIRDAIGPQPALRRLLTLFVNSIRLCPGRFNKQVGRLNKSHHTGSWGDRLWTLDKNFGFKQDHVGRGVCL